MNDFSNYFNYFTEIEEHFQRARGTSLFLLSPMDWALIETWKNSGIPLDAALRGIDAAFDKWRSRRNKVQRVNSLAFCAQAVLLEAQRTPENASVPSECEPPFPEAELRAYLEKNAARLRALSDPEFAAVAASLETLLAALAEHLADTEDLERRLTVLEQRLIAIARSRETEEQALALRAEMDQQLRAYRGKMTAGQLSMLERQYLDRRLLEKTQLPRLSLFYL